MCFGDGIRGLLFCFPGGAGPNRKIAVFIRLCFPPFPGGLWKMKAAMEKIEMRREELCVYKSCWIRPASFNPA